MRFERMDLNHIPAVEALEALCFSMPWSKNALMAELEQPLSLWLVAMEGDQVAGYVGSQLVPPESDMMNLAVLPVFRRQGVARQLVSTLLAELKRQGITSLTLEVRASNVPAIKLYEALGFCLIGKRPNYYKAPKEDAMIYRKEWDA